MTKEKRTIYIDGVKLGFKNAVYLLNLINSTHEKLKKDNKNSMSCISIKKQLSEYLAQWENVQLGDLVKYKGNQVVLMPNKPEPKQMEFNFNG
tara:strand:- start:183 stop:461 length:279 start_codon:yes stop_codon:yes gene_type:complete